MWPMNGQVICMCNNLAVVPDANVPGVHFHVRFPREPGRQRSRHVPARSLVLGGLNVPPHRGRALSVPRWIRRERAPSSVNLGDIVRTDSRPETRTALFQLPTRIYAISSLCESEDRCTIVQEGVRTFTFIRFNDCDRFNPLLSRGHLIRF